MVWDGLSLRGTKRDVMIILRIKEAVDMRNGFTSGMLIGGIVGATMSMIMNNDIDVNKTKSVWCALAETCTEIKAHCVGYYRYDALIVIWNYPFWSLFSISIPK